MLDDIVTARFERTASVTGAFFDANADKIAIACYEMAKRFSNGGRLLACGTGAAATDAQHIAVEFVHPVVVGKKALPALALDARVATRELDVLGRAQDIFVTISDVPPDADLSAAIAAARAKKMLTVVMCGATSPVTVDCDYAFTIISDDTLVVQETMESAYHIMWETVHVFLENAH